MNDPKEQADLDNHANQLNPNHEEYRGDDNYDDVSDQKDDKEHDYDNDNRSNQMNPNHEEYRGKK